MTIKSMQVNDLKSKLDQNENIVLVDCREQNEWDAGHIAAATFLPLSDIEKNHTQLTDKNAEIILQCRSGKRSMTYAHFLADQGYTNLTNLEGGILAWQEEGHDVAE